MKTATAVNKQSEQSTPITIVRGLAGALVGAVLGYFALRWMIQQGLYSMVLPGGLIGYGCGVAMQRRFVPMGIAVGILTLAFNLYLEWHFFPFVADGSLTYFLMHLHHLLPLHLLMIVLGAVLAYWLGAGRNMVGGWR